MQPRQQELEPGQPDSQQRNPALPFGLKWCFVERIELLEKLHSQEVSLTDSKGKQISLEEITRRTSRAR